MSNEIVSIILGFLIGIVFFALPDIGKIKINDDKWKCTQAVIINNDPSKTECIVYKRIDKE